MCLDDMAILVVRKPQPEGMAVGIVGDILHVVAPFGLAIPYSSYHDSQHRPLTPPTVVTLLVPATVTH